MLQPPELFEITKKWSLKFEYSKKLFHTEICEVKSDNKKNW